MASSNIAQIVPPGDLGDLGNRLLPNWHFRHTTYPTVQRYQIMLKCGSFDADIDLKAITEHKQ